MATDSCETTPNSAAANEPWKERADWAAGKIRSSQHTLVTFVAFTLFWNAVSWTGAVLGWQGFQRHGRWVMAFVAVFPFVGVLMALATVLAILRRLKFGNSMFEMASVPGVLGGPLAGVVQVPRKLHPQFGFKVKLNCIRHYYEGDDSKQELLWQDEQLLGRELFDESADATAIPIQFAIPYDVRESEKQKRETIQWQLEVQAEDPGIDYHETFDVPVFRTEASSPDFKLDKAVLAPFVINPTREEVLRAAKIVHEPMAAGECFVFPPGRPLGAAFAVTGFLAIWIGMIVVFIYLELPIIFPIVMGCFGLLIVWMCVDIWLWNSRIEIEGSEVRIRSDWLGFGRTVTTSRAEVESTELKQRMRSGTHAWFDVMLVTKSDEKLHFGRYVYGPRLAKAVADMVMEAIRGGR